MASAINSDNGVVSGTAGLKSSADSSGVLDLQTNGTTAISISASQVVSFANQPTYTGGTANGVMFLNGSKAVTTGTALTFDGAILGVNGISVGRGAGAVATNTAVGASALASNSTGAEVTAIGYQALFSNTGSQSTAVGVQALRANTSGSNAAFGQFTLYANTTGTANAGFGGYGGSGNQTLVANTTGSYNSAFGMGALAANTTASNNTAVGYQAAYSNTTGTDNVAIGKETFKTNTTGNTNTAIGNIAMLQNTTGSSNVAVGYDSLRNNTTASNNTAVGYQSLYDNTTGAANVAVGLASLANNTTAEKNVAVGVESLETNTTGQYNVALGTQALRLNTTASYNTAVGFQTLYSNTTGTENTAIGRVAGYSNTTGSYNAFLGHDSGYFTTSSNNTFVGHLAGYYVTTGAKNTILGRFHGNQGGLDIRTASNHIVLSDGDGNPRGIFDNNGNFLVGTTSTYASAKMAMGFVGSANNGFVINNTNSSGSPVHIAFQLSGTSVGSITCSGASTAYNTSSDQRLKENIQNADSASALIDSLQVRKFDWKADGSHQRYGFVAQELATVYPEAVHQPEDTDEMMAVDYSKLVPLLVKEIQSLKARLDAANL